MESKEQHFNSTEQLVSNIRNKIIQLKTSRLDLDPVGLHENEQANVELEDILLELEEPVTRLRSLIDDTYEVIEPLRKK